MAKNKEITLLHLFMNGYRVGMLSRPPDGGMDFSYDSEWQKSEGGRPISLSLPLGKKQHRGNVVYNYFDNLLPDNPDIRTRIQRRFGSKTAHPFDLLSSIGSDCIGAIQLTEDQIKIPDVKQVTAKPLSEADIAGFCNLLQVYAKKRGKKNQKKITKKKQDLVSIF